jgi:hypothetical protein
MGEFFKTVFGEYTTIQLLGYLWFFFIGYVIYFLIEASGRDIYSKATPVKWSWKFWFFDNWRRYLATILCTYVLFRFYIEINGHPFDNFDAVQIGLLGDGIAATVKKRIGGIGLDRREYMNTYDEDGNYNEDNSQENNDNGEHRLQPNSKEQQTT